MSNESERMEERRLERMARGSKLSGYIARAYDDGGVDAAAELLLSLVGKFADDLSAEERRQAQQDATRDRSAEQTTSQRIKSAVAYTPDQEAQVNQCRHHLKAGHTEDFLIGMGYAQAAIDKAVHDMSKLGRE